MSNKLLHSPGENQATSIAYVSVLSNLPSPRYAPKRGFKLSRREGFFASSGAAPASGVAPAVKATTSKRMNGGFLIVSPAGSVD